MKEAPSLSVSATAASSIDATPDRLPAETSFLDRLPPALVTDLRQITGRLETPFRGLSLQDVITEFLPLLDQLGHLGATGAELAIVLAELGLRAPDGTPYARGTVSKAISRARKAAASGRLRQPAATCGAGRQESARSGTSWQNAALSVIPRPDAASAGTERHGAASSGALRLQPPPGAGRHTMNAYAKEAGRRLKSLCAEDDI